MKKAGVVIGVCVGLFMVVAPPISRAQADAKRVTVERATTDPAVIKAKVARKQAEIRAKVAAAMADNEMPVVKATPIPTAKPTPVPTAAPVAAVSEYTGSVPERIAAAWPGDDAKVLRVVKCESNFNPAAVSKSGKYRGLLQADASFWKSYGGLQYAPSADKASVEGQMAVMWRGYQARGWSPWPHCGKK